MSVLIDTAVLGEILKPGSEGARWARRWLVHEPIHVSAISVFEVAFGFQQAVVQALRREHDSQASQWRSRAEQFASFVRQESFAVCPYGLDAAVVASYLYARAPTPSPAGWRRTRARKKSKTEIRRSWLLDVKIAATAISLGKPILTTNVADFSELGGLLPAEWALQVLKFPDQAPQHL